MSRVPLRLGAFLAAGAWSGSALKTASLMSEVESVWEMSERIGYSTAGIIHQFWWMGAIVTMVGATMTIVGLMLQKSSHKEGIDKAQEEGPYWMRWRWLLGLVVWLLGQAVCWAADGLANRSLLACFNCWNIVVVFVFAPWYLGESVVRMAGAGAAITLCGCIWVVLTGPRRFHLQTVETLEHSWLSVGFICLTAFALLSALALAVRTRWARHPAPFAPMQLAALSAIFAWYAVLLSKCGSTLTVTSVESKSQFGHWQFWAYLVAMAAFAVCQVHTLNMAMKIGTAISVLPTYESLSMIGQVILCGVFFDEFRGFQVDDFIHFSCAIASVLVGIAVMTSAAASGCREQDSCSPDTLDS